MDAVISLIKYAAVGAAISLDIGILRWEPSYRCERRRENLSPIMFLFRMRED